MLEGPHPKDKPLDEFEAYYRDTRLKPRNLEGLAGFVDALISVKLAVSLVGFGLIIVLIIYSGVAGD